ncbi:hypothetical protein A2U01_0099383, partial [Trifolium medium]|nr:hypothetical protein [Trifolium medium]
QTLFTAQMLVKVRELSVRLFQRHHLRQLWASPQLSL